jgi:hypothetical protein
MHNQVTEFHPYRNYNMAMNSPLWKSQSVQQQIQLKLLFFKETICEKNSDHTSACVDDAGRWLECLCHLT